MKDDLFPALDLSLNCRVRLSVPLLILTPLPERAESVPISVNYHLARHEPQTWTNMVGVSSTCQLLKSLVGPVYSSLLVVDNTAKAQLGKAFLG